MIYDGKTYRNLESQVGYLTDVAEALDERITEVAANIPSKMIVEELPETGDPNITYYVGPKGTEPNLYYEVWVWVQEEPDGPFVWRELEDTDQVDLSGYLEKDTTSSTYPKVYVKWGDGTQGLENLTQDNTYNAVVRRKADGRITVPAPSADGDCANKKYVDDNFVAKVSGETSYQQVYAKAQNGSQFMFTVVQQDALANTLPQRDGSGRLWGAAPSGNNPLHLVNLQYADDHYLAKQTGSSSYNQAYVKGTDGTQLLVELADTARYNALVRRTNQAQIVLPNQVDYPPTDDQAVSKRFVSAVVGQLLYLHDIELIINIDSTNKLYVKAFLINGSPTAITEFNRIVYRRIDVQWGAFGPDIANAEAVAVTKLPDGFRQDEFDEPFVGFLYQYISGGNLVSGKTTSSMSTTITDTVISW